MLGKFDLNLLLVFDTVMTERSVKRAAQHLDMNAPAVSKALGRLKDAVGQELFTRTGNGVRPTPRAVALWEGIKPALSMIRSSVAGVDTFDPATEQRIITLDLPSGADTLLMPKLAARVADAPGLLFRVANARAFNVLNELRYGASWLALDYRPVQEPGYRCEVISRQRIVLVARAGHPRLRAPLTTELYQSLPQVALASVRSASVLPVTELLEPLGISRNLKFTVPGLAALVRMLVENELVATLPVCTVDHIASFADVETYTLPFAMPEMTFYMVWHERFDTDAAHGWLRNEVRTICAGL